MSSKIKNTIIITICLVIGIVGIKLIINNLPTKDDSDLEIEKKWLILKEDIPYDLEKADKYDIVQTYISFNPEMRVRNINDGVAYILTVKRDTEELGLTREEYEIYISEEEYYNLLKKQEGTTIYKTRYQMKDENDLMMAFDIFSGDLTGLAYLEVEFKNKEDAKQF